MSRSGRTGDTLEEKPFEDSRWRDPLSLQVFHINKQIYKVTLELRGSTGKDHRPRGPIPYLLLYVNVEIALYMRGVAS